MMKTKLCWFFLCVLACLCLTPGISEAQNRQVSGTVTGDQNEALIGAAVRIQGTNTIVVTGVDGGYTLPNVPVGSTLEFSYLGYLTREVVANSTVLNVALTPDSQSIDEVVVIGYGTQRRGDVTSSISTVKAEDFAVGQIRDAADLIRGKVAGLTITSGTGDPNEDATLRLRGTVSLQASRDPLVLVDGLVGDLRTVAPENIASIDVLKDASAAAIYGTRGAGGVILITTKTGIRNADTKISYNGYVSLSTFGKKLEFMDAEDIRAGRTNYKDGGYETDWVDEISRPAFTHNHNLNISGGNQKTTYSADFTYNDYNGAMITTYSKSMRMNFDVAHWMLNDMVKVQMNVQHYSHEGSITNTRVNQSGRNNNDSNVWRQAIIRNPTEPVYNEDGSYFENWNINYYYNPVELLKERKTIDENERSRMMGAITFEPIKGWQTKMMVATQRMKGHNREYKTSQFYDQKPFGRGGTATHSNNNSRRNDLEITSNYNTRIGEHRIDALAGYSYDYYVRDDFSAMNRDFSTDFFMYNNLGQGEGMINGEASMSSNKQDEKLIAFFGRISYGYANKYNVLLSLRREGSSKFGINNKWGSFPSASVGWTISNERFMKDVAWVSNLRLRASYGVTGVTPGSNYNAMTRYSYSGYYFNNGIWLPALGPASTNPNPDLKWEKSQEVNIGVDFGVLNDRLGFSVDVYNKNTSGLLWDYTVPVPPNRSSLTLMNVGKMRNRGFEMMINAVPVMTRNFEWNTTIVGSHNANKLVSLSNDLYKTANIRYIGGFGEPVSGSSHIMEVGKALGSYYWYKAVGVSDDGRWLVENKKTGEIKPFQEGGTGATNNDDYRQVLGNGTPKFNLGWSNQLRYKNWDLSLQFTGQFGYQILNEARVFYESNYVQYNRLKSVMDAPFGGKNTLSGNQKQLFTSYHLENGNYLKLTNAKLGYSVPVKANKYIRSVYAYVAATNLFVLTGYSGLDPELSSPRAETAGIDNRDKYPITKAYTFGVNVTF